MATSGGGFTPIFLSQNYFGTNDPQFRWKYEWQYDVSADAFNVTFTLQSNASARVDLRMSYNSTSPGYWVQLRSEGTVYATINNMVYHTQVARAFEDWSTQLTATIPATQGKATINMPHNARWYNGNTGQRTSSSNFTIDLEADTGAIYIDNGTAFEAYQVMIDNGESYDAYLPYIDNGTSWDPLG